MQQAAIQDLAYGLRILSRNPAFSIAALLSPALGIGANTAIFQILDAIRLRMLPVDQKSNRTFASTGALDGLAIERIWDFGGIAFHNRPIRSDFLPGRAPAERNQHSHGLGR
jgi:hypothetical protein